MHGFLQQWAPIVVGLLAALFIVIGARLALKPARDIEESPALTRVFAFGTGAFFTAVCLDFLPDAWSGGGGDSTALWIFFGALILWLGTNASDGWFHREQNKANDSMDDTSLMKFTPLSAIVLAAALSFHTFFEGAAVALAFHNPNGSTVGFALAMILHKLPEGILWGLALAAVFPTDRSKIRRVLMVPAVCTLVGVLLGVFLADHASSQALQISTGFVAGAMFYIAFAELLPALRETKKPRMSRTWFLIGLAVMFALNSFSNIFGGG